MILSLLFVLLLSFGCSDKKPEEGKDPEKKDEEEVDMEKFPNYIDEEKAVYNYGFKETITPYWLGNIIYNETVLLVGDDDGIKGKLQYAPKRILSIRDFSLKNEYPLDKFNVDGNVISISSDIGIPFLTKENLKGKNLSEPYREVSTISNVLTDWVMMGPAIYTESPLYYGNQISVTYLYDVKDLKMDTFPKSSNTYLPKLKSKLSGGDDVKIVAIGDSVGEGCSCSKKFNHEPFLDNFFELFRQSLEDRYESKVVLDNQCVGGKTSEWGCASQQVQKIINASPDVLYIHFGINDLGSKFSANGFQDNMEALILEVQSALPNCEFVIINCMAPNQDLYDFSIMERYWGKMEQLAERIENTFILDMYSISKELLINKKYFDITGNGINHINDYATRLYTMGLIASLY